MAKPDNRPYSRYSRDAAQLLGRLIRRARIEQGLTAEALAERAGISRGLVQRIERGEMGCAIGAVFEAAAIVGVATGRGRRAPGSVALGCSCLVS